MSDRMKMLAKIKDKKGESKMSDEYKDAKKGLLQQLMGDMSGMMAEPLKGMKKVEVSSNSPEGLEHGLDKAKEIIGNKDDATLSDGDAEEQAEEVAHKDLDMDNEEGESPEHQEAVMGDHEVSGIPADHQDHEMSHDEIDEEIARLMAMKEAKE